MMSPAINFTMGDMLGGVFPNMCNIPEALQDEKFSKLCLARSLYHLNSYLVGRHGIC